MIPLIIAGVTIAVLSVLLENEKKPARNYSPSKEKRKRKVFISFAIEDIIYRDFLVEQARHPRSPFSFIDMSVKEPWNERIWQEHCRRKIRQCDAMICLLSKNTWQSSGARWEMKCAQEEGLKVIGMHIKKFNRGSIPPELKNAKIIDWTWDNLGKFLKP